MPDERPIILLLCPQEMTSANLNEEMLKIHAGKKWREKMRDIFIQWLRKMLSF